MRMRSVIAQVARRLNNRAAVGEDRGTEIHPIYMQADSDFTAEKTGASTLLNPIFRIPLPPLNQAETTRTATTADCRSPAGLRQPGPARLDRHPATQQSRPKHIWLGHGRIARATPVPNWHRCSVILWQVPTIKHKNTCATPGVEGTNATPRDIYA